MRTDVKRFVRECPCCQKARMTTVQQFTPHYIQNTFGVFDNIAIDSIHMPKSAKGNHYLLVFIDTFSRYVNLYPIADLSARTALGCLQQFISDYGHPSTISCDNGSQFKGVFKAFTDLIGVETLNIHPYSHQENGIVERANRTILQTLRSLVMDKKSHDLWDEVCYSAKLLINSRTHSAIGVAPYTLVFGKVLEPLRGIVFPHASNVDVSDDYLTALIQGHEDLVSRAIEVQNRNNSKHVLSNQGRTQVVFDLNSNVLIIPETDPVDKLAPRRKGPYRIISRDARREGDVYTCQHWKTGKLEDFRVDKLIPFFTRSHGDELRAATMDDESYIVEAIQDHRFSGTRSKNNLQLLVKWESYPEPDWQPYMGNNLDHVIVVHEYLRTHNMSKFLPKWTSP